MPNALVTNDSCMKDGERDPTDEDILREVGPGYIIMNVREMLEHMEKQEPEKFQQFKELSEKKAGKRLTVEELQDFCQAANEKKEETDRLTQFMSTDEAEVVRAWRVGKRKTWRSVARAAYRHWWWSFWAPPSNQIAGMSLCDQAAKLLGEDYLKAPWN